MQARRILFNPSTCDMQYYARTLQAEDGKHFPIAAQLCTIFFMLYKDQWMYLKPFIEGGGLLAAVALLGSENKHMVSQVSETVGYLNKKTDFLLTGP
jgi:hypothetical protein